MSRAAVVLGAGANALAAAHLLARAGHRVQVLDPRPAPAQACAEIGWVPPALVRALELERHGFAQTHPDPWISAPLPQGGRLELWCDPARSVEAIRKVSPADAARWPEFCARMARLAGLLEKLCAAAPLEPTRLGFALRARGLGREGLQDLLRTVPMPVADLLEDWFENDTLKGLLGAAGVAQLRHGPRAGGTALRLLLQHAGCPAGVFRPPRSNLREILERLPGLALRRAAPIERIEVRDARVAGVALSGGEVIEAPLVLSGLDPRDTLLRLADPGWLDPELARSVRHIRARGVVARLSLRLDRAPGFAHLVLAPSLEHLERAADDAKYGRASGAPWLEARSDGTDRVQAEAQCVPYALAEGAWDEARASTLGDRLVRMLSPHLDGATILEHELQLPADLERCEGWPEGQSHHAEPTLDQMLWMRPLPELARYRTPIEGLFLCGSGMHPGGGFPGTAGYLCAREVAVGPRRG
jgi:phytoene dehydrogenase-like protein